MVQMHDATRLHFDFRLEIDGVFKSWAVPKGPSLNPLDQRLAVFVEDHPLKYGSFEGIIPKGNYGAGTVMIWDEGTYVERTSETRKQSEEAIRKGFEKGHMTFILDGHKLKGEFALIKLKKDGSQKAWLLVKKRDEHATYKRTATFSAVSAKTGRTIEQIGEQSEAAGNVWLPKRKKTATAPALRVAKLTTTQKKRDPMPRKIKPMLSTVSRDGVEGKQWLFETDHGGFRAIAEIAGKTVHLYSKAGLSFAKKFPQVVESLQILPVPMVLDGEITNERGKVIYHVFDILYLDGRDLRDLPLRERKKILAKAFAKNAHVQQVPAGGRGATVAKNLESTYKAGTTREWLLVDETGNKTTKASAAADEPRLTNLDKIFWPQENFTKGDLITYYRTVAPYILPYLQDRPESLNRHPNGITGGGFYQKDMTGHIPRWLKTERIFSESADKSIDYVVCQDERSLLYIVNLGCIEINPWFSRIGHLEQPDFMVIDLDPDGNDFRHVIEIAHEVRKILDAIGAANFCKTSGATGIHIGVPTGARYDFDAVRDLAESVCRIIAKRYPATTSIDRNPNRRHGKIYLDYMQNRRGQTLAAPFCVRPRAGAPVSMPVLWKELTPRLRPEHFHIKNAASRIQKMKDPWAGVLGAAIDLEKCVRALQRKFLKA